ncbi:adenylate cyclase [Achromobacter insuavis]|uniref:YXWGXW repeat-containing protein n=1 Tax=Achromobacter insuavis TaxID=1287735 RepID=UPI003B9A9982
MNAIARIPHLRPLAAAILMTVGAGAVAQTYAPPPAPPAPAAPAYDSGDPANANLAPIDRSPQPPPPLPVYTQPPAPGDGYMWVPGYWSLNRYGYFWVPGAWVLAPYTGALWTPGYWGFVDGVYLWHAGYWGPHIGFYGGINYGFGYIGIGFVGGYWDHDRFFYNRAVTNINVTRVTNVYNHTVVVNNNIDNRRISYNGGPAGIQRRADPREVAARNEPHRPPTDLQRGFARDAGGNRAQFFDRNQGRPPQAFVDHAPPQGQRPGGGPGNGPNGAGPGARPDMNRGNPTAMPAGAAPGQARTPPQAQQPGPGRAPQAEAPGQPRGPQAQPQGQFHGSPQAQPQAQPQARPQPAPRTGPPPDNLAQAAAREHRAAPQNRPESRPPQASPQHAGGGGGGRPQGGHEAPRGGDRGGAPHERGRE